MRLIPLTKGLFAKVDDEDFEWLSQWKWVAAMTRPGVHYATRSGRKDEAQKSYRMHRVLMPGGFQIDHADHDTLNNQKANLRHATRSHNAANSKLRSDNTTGLKGVAPSNGKWVAQICYMNHRHWLGRFDTPEEAGRAYDSKALELFGEFAFLNYPITKP